MAMQLRQPQQRQRQKLRSRSFGIDGYRLLLMDFIPRPITSDKQNREYLRKVVSLIEKDERSKEEDEFRAVLGALIQDYERKRNGWLFETKVSPAEILKDLMAEHKLTQSGFVPDIPQSRVSEILQKRRKISLSQAIYLGKRFRLNPTIFIESD